MSAARAGGTGTRSLTAAGCSWAKPKQQQGGPPSLMLILLDPWTATSRERWKANKESNSARHAGAGQFYPKLGARPQRLQRRWQVCGHGWALQQNHTCHVSCFFTPVAVGRDREQCYTYAVLRKLQIFFPTIFSTIVDPLSLFFHWEGQRSIVEPRSEKH